MKLYCCGSGGTTLKPTQEILGLIFLRKSGFFSKKQCCLPYMTFVVSSNFTKIDHGDIYIYLYINCVWV
jgi:hypothetical protein